MLKYKQILKLEDPVWRDAADWDMFRCSSDYIDVFMEAVV